MAAASDLPKMDDFLLSVLCCPVTKQPLRVADAAVLRRVNAGRPDGAAATQAGWQAGLVREDGRMFYPVEDGIAVLLAEAGVPL